MIKKETTVEDIARINACYKKIQNDMVYLADRWSDEGQYENIDDYRKLIASIIPPEFTIVKMTKRPFGFRFTIGTEAVYFIRVTRNSYQWGRVS